MRDRTARRVTRVTGEAAAGRRYRPGGTTLARWRTAEHRSRVLWAPSSPLTATIGHCCQPCARLIDYQAGDRFDLLGAP